MKFIELIFLPDNEPQSIQHRVYFGHLSIFDLFFRQIMNTSQTPVHQPRQTFSPSLSSPIENDGRQCSETNEDNINPKNNEKKDKIRW